MVGERVGAGYPHKYPKSKKDLPVMGRCVRVVSYPSTVAFFWSARAKTGDYCSKSKRKVAKTVYRLASVWLPFGLPFGFKALILLHFLLR